jgi:hypothetical protein
MADRYTDPSKANSLTEPDKLRRLLDGYADPGRIRRLRDCQRPGWGIWRLLRLWSSRSSWRR